MGYNERLNNKILPLVYASNCSGSVVVDKSNPYVADQPTGQTMSDAYAQKFIPTSKCLASIEVQMKTPNIIYAEDVVVEIMKDSGGSPIGNPQSSNNIGQYIIPRSQITTSWKLFNIPLNIELDNSDLSNGVWIVITSYIYDPAYTIDAILRLYQIRSLSGSTSLGPLFIKEGTNAWRLIGGMLYFKSFKQTFTPPIVCPNPVVALTIPT